jgi:hypothetical protein
VPSFFVSMDDPWGVSDSSISRAVINRSYRTRSLGFYGLLLLWRRSVTAISIRGFSFRVLA